MGNMWPFFQSKSDLGSGSQNPANILRPQSNLMEADKILLSESRHEAESSTVEKKEQNLINMRMKPMEKRDD